MTNKINSISLDCMKFQYGGGMERYIIDLVNGLHQESIEPIVYSTKFNKLLKEYQFIKPVKVNLSFIPKLLRNLFLLSLFHRVKGDEVSITTIYTLADILICGGNHKGYIEAIKKRATLSDKFKVRNEHKALSHAKLVIAHSKMMRHELVELYNVDNNKITVVYPPVDVNRFTLPQSNQIRKELRKKFGFDDNEIIYLFPSTGHSRKGFDLLKQYFEQSNLPIRLAVAGTPVTESKNVTSLGYCKNMPELYQAADYTIMASVYEPFGLVGVESILSGTPVIFSDNMGCLEILKNNFGYSFSRNNIDTLDNAIKVSTSKALSYEHRINDPFDCLDYNPALSAHIENLLHYINELK